MLCNGTIHLAQPRQNRRGALELPLAANLSLYTLVYELRVGEQAIHPVIVYVARASAYLKL